MIAFAEEFDPLPMDIDETAATDTMFGGLIASGLHTLDIAIRLVVTEFIQGDEPVATICGSRIDDMRFHVPVRPGDSLHVAVEIFR
jgi:acyl dehydratase